MIISTYNPQQKRDRFLRYTSRNNRWTVRDYLPGDEKEILQLFRKIFHPSFSEDDWRWKYLHNPAGKALIKVAVKNPKGNIVAHQAAMPSRFKIGENRLTGYLSVDSMIDEGFRGSGLFAELSLRLWENVREKKAFVFGFPNESAHSSSLKLGARKILPLHPLFRILRTEADLSRAGYTPFHLHALKWICKFSKMSADIERRFCKAEYRIFEIEQFSEWAEEFLERVSRQHPIMVLRDQAYLNWRYGEKYKKFAIFRNSKALGYAVLAIEEKWGCRTGVLVDWLLDEAELKAGFFLWNHCETYLRNQGAMIACGFFSSLNKESSSLKKTGFLTLEANRSPKKFDLMLLPDVLRQELAERDFHCMMDPKNWFLTLGDTDTI